VRSSTETLTVVMEPTGLAWLPIALFLRARFPQAVLVRAKEQKVVGLRRFLEVQPRVTGWMPAPWPSCPCWTRTPGAPGSAQS
jgi:hypothetical protein